MNEIMINAGLIIEEIESEQNNLFEPADYIELIERLAEKVSCCRSECPLTFKCPYSSDGEECAYD